MEEYLIDFENIPWESPEPGIRFKAFVRGDRKLRLVEFTEELYEEKWCRKGHAGYVLDGRMTIDFNGREVVFRKGDGLFIPEGEEHRHKPHVAEGERVLIIMFEKA
jgi:quercetin dioxygenase-like cupin family protein